MNAYFQIINDDKKTCLRLVPATDGGEELDNSVLLDYLNFHEISCDLSELNRALSTLSKETVIVLNDSEMLPIAGDLKLTVEEGNMRATGVMIPPSSKGAPLSYSDILAELKGRGVVYGIKEEEVRSLAEHPRYMEKVVLAEGTPARQGKDAHIEYFFNTDLKAKPTLMEDGSVDFFNLNIINHCMSGDLLARLLPADPGDDGKDLSGTVIRPRMVKRDIIRFGKNIRQTEDKLEIYATESGHVSLIDGRVFVTNLMELENVDTATGNIEFKGNVQVNGNVNSNFSIKAVGNVEVRGVVEGAVIEAGGNITIARGMNGMGKGVLKAGGNIISKFIENAKVEAEGYVQSESIIHSDVIAGTEVTVDGKHGFISGGRVSASSQVDAKILGSEMGTDTIIEVGISPLVKRHHKELSEKIEENTKVLERAVPILEAARERIQMGKTLSESQVDNIRDLVEVVRTKKAELKVWRDEYAELDLLLDNERPAQVLVGKIVYPGTRIVISNVSKLIKEPFQYCKFIRYQGDVKMVGRD